MLKNDIINPLLNDYLTSVTGYGGPFFKSIAITKLNDFTEYLTNLTYPNFEFAFYPLREDQSIGYGNLGHGIGLLATGSPIIFPNSPKWDKKGMVLGPLNQAGIVDFSGKFTEDFQFRKDTCSVFYFLQHSRQSFPTTFYRPNIEKIPYFCFDQSHDHFSVTSPSFSKSRFRGRGTTYIYDEIYGEDQKGLQMDWSEKPTLKYYLPEALSFYQMDKDVSSAQYICINGTFSLYNYKLRTIYGKDYRYLSGNFISPYSYEEIGYDELNQAAIYKYFFPQRIVIGAGVSNKNYEYDVAGMDHYCPGFLILKGDYSDKADEIAQKMSDCFGLSDTSFLSYTGINENSATKDYSYITAGPTGIKYFQSLPRNLNQGKETTSFSARIKSLFLKFIGIVRFEKYPWGLWGYASLEQADVVIEPTDESRYKTGILDYKYPILGTEYNQVTGFISGYLYENGNRLIFPADNLSGKSGFYYQNSEGEIKQEFFPPYKAYANQKITGFVSGTYDGLSFNPLDKKINVSGYYLDGQKFFLNAETGIVAKNIIGYISGTINSSGFFSGFDGSDINQTSGYIDAGSLIPFPPYKYISGREPINGYIRGFLSGGTFLPFSEIVYLYDSFGNVTGSIETTETISGYFYENEQIPFQTGSYFSGFENMPYAYEYLDYQFSGFFIEQSGFVFDPETQSGYMSGYIGSKKKINYSGNFDEFNSVNGFDEAIDYNYVGFFSGSSGFSGADPNWQLFDTENQAGILTGYIGSYTYIDQLYGSLNFDGKPGFSPLTGYGYSGFFVESSGFSGQGNIGEMTGIIGYRTVEEGAVQFNHFSGISGFDITYYSNVLANFENATGFSGINNQSFGLGVFTGIISSGYAQPQFARLFADDDQYEESFYGFDNVREVTKLSISTGLSTYAGYDFQVTGLYNNSGVQSIGAPLLEDYVSGELPLVVGFLSGCFTQDTVSRLGEGCGYFKTEDGNNRTQQSFIYIKEKDEITIDFSQEGPNTKTVGNFGSDDFTLEMWVKPLQLDFNKIPKMIRQQEIYTAGGKSYVNGSLIDNWYLVFRPNGYESDYMGYTPIMSGDNPAVRFYFDSGRAFYSGYCMRPYYIDGIDTPGIEDICESFIESVSGQNLNSGQWNHIAVVRKNNSIRLFLNGYGGTPKTISNDAVIGHYNDHRLWISKSFQPIKYVFVGDSTYSNIESPFEGYIEDFRITTGTNSARYQFDFSTGFLGRFGNNINDDPLYDNVDLLINMTGIYGFSSFTDNSKHNRDIKIYASTIRQDIVPKREDVNNPPHIPLITGKRFNFTRSGFLINNTYYNFTNNDFDNIPYLTESKNIDIVRPFEANTVTYNLPGFFNFSGFNLGKMTSDSENNCRSYTGYVGQKLYYIPGFIFSNTYTYDDSSLEASLNNVSYYSGLIAMSIISGSPIEGEIAEIDASGLISEIINVIPEIKNLIYRDGSFNTGISGMSGVSGPNPSGDTATISCNIPSIELIEPTPFEIYPYIRAVSGLTYFTPKIKSIDFYEDVPGFGGIDYSRVTATIQQVTQFTTRNEFQFTDSGVGYSPEPINLSTEQPHLFSDVTLYGPQPLLLTASYPIIIEQITNEFISEEIKDDPYFDNVVLLLNMSGKNLSRNILDSSKYHHKVIAALGAGQFDDLISYRPSGLSGIYLPWIIESAGNYSASGLNVNSISINKETGTFGGSGVYINNDLAKSIETAGFGVSGVILITGSGVF